MAGMGGRRRRARPAGLYAPVIQILRRRRIIAGNHRVVFGTPAAGEHGLAAWGWQITTAVGERLKLSLRPRGAALGRRRAPPWKREDGWRQPLALCQVSHNCGLPHARLRQPFVAPVSPQGMGATQA